MSDARAAVGFDRLPWLADEPQPRSQPRRQARKPAPRRGRELAGWLVAALLAVAGAAYWIGFRSVAPQEAAERSPGSAATVPLPEAKPLPPPQPEVAIEPAPEVSPVASPPVPVIAHPVPTHRTRPVHSATRAAPAPAPKAATAEAPAKPPAPVADPMRPWPVRVEQNAYGRLVRIGTFASPQQAKRGWSKIMRLYPGMRRLPALVVPLPSTRDGRVYYRLQMGTTSQAHSTVLCQRMRMIAQSCVVIGLRSGRGA